MKLHWGNAIFIFFAIFLSLAAVFIVFTYSQKNDLVTDDYYEKGANYSEQMEMDKRSYIYADSIVIEQKAESLLFILSPSFPDLTEQLNVHFFRSSDKDLDYKTTIQTQTDTSIIDKNKFAKGRYKVKIDWEHNSQTYYLQKEIWIKK